jgi:excisionase family DNA binding protein
MGERLLSVSQLAAYLGISTNTVYSWVSSGRLPIIKVGARTMFDPDEIRGWIRLRSRSAETPKPQASQSDAPLSLGRLVSAIPPDSGEV